MKNKGISLIVLVVTIIVIIILAGAVILSLTQNNPINEANQATFKTNIEAYNSELMLYVSKQYGETLGSFDIKSLNATTPSEVKIIITSMKDADKEKFEIQKSELVYIKEKCSENEIKWLKEMGIKEKDAAVIPPVEEFSVNKPKLTEGMTAVKWDGNAWVNVANAETDTSWYSYEAQEGTTDGKTSKWANAKTNDGSMWVWIPRYAYKIATPGTKTPSVIDVKFLSGITNNTDNKGTAVDSTYIVHPAFTNNVAAGGWDKELTGIWVAKYEAGYAVTSQGDTQVISNEVYTQATTNYYGAITSGSTKITYPVYKANKYVYNYINVGDSYKIARAMTAAGNPYGLNASTSDTHMMKNSEWGAVAYLTHSKYGRNGTEITINLSNANNNPATIYPITAGGNGTNGLAANEKTAITSNKLQSSTGNEYGIYDLSGGSWERIAGYINNGNANLATYGQNIINDGGLGNSTKYKTVYAHDTTTDNQTNNYVKAPNPTRKGEAIWETSANGNTSNGSWFDDYSYFVDTSDPWFVRGGGYGNGSNAGAFTFLGTNGSAHGSYGFRAVLVAL